MVDESDPITAVAKAVEETAKTGQALVEAGSDLARFVGKALGTAPEDTVGLLGGNLLHQLHIRNLDKVSRKTEEILRQRGVEEPKPIGSKALLPALEAASEETDETLQDMWASLLANAMDPGKETSLQRVFIEALRQMEPIDVLILRQVAREGPESILDAINLAEQLERRDTLIAVSVNRLAEIGAVILKKTQTMGYYALSPLGMELYLACQSDAED